MNFSIIIPVYNEKENIAILIKEIIKYVHKKYIYEIIVIDDFSDDNNYDVLSLIKKQYNVTVVSHQENQGQSKAILTGIVNSKYDNILTIDGDLQNNPKDINKLLDQYFSDDNNFDLVSGIRIKRKDTYIKIISSIIANKVRSFVLKDNCPDTGCSLKIFDKKIFLNFEFFDGIHRFLPALF